MTDRGSDAGDGFVSTPCPKFSSLFDATSRQGDAWSSSADTPLGAAQIEHLASCGTCRLRLAELDPTHLFSLLSLERKDESFFLGFETRVMARIRESEGQQRPLLRLFGARTYALAGGMALIAAAAMMVVEIGPRGPGLRLASNTAAPLVASPGRADVPQSPNDISPRTPGSSTEDRDGLHESQPPAPPHLPELKAEAPAAVESIASTTAQIISIKVGEKEQGASDVVLIVDQGMDI